MKELTAVIDDKSVRFGYKDQFGHNYTLQQLNRKMKSGVKLINAVTSESVFYDSKKPAKSLNLDEVSQLIALGADPTELSKQLSDDRISLAKPDIPLLDLNHQGGELAIRVHGEVMRAIIAESSITQEPRLVDPYSISPYSYYEPRYKASIELKGYLL